MIKIFYVYMACYPTYYKINIKGSFEETQFITFKKYFNFFNINRKNYIILDNNKVFI